MDDQAGSSIETRKIIMSIFDEWELESFVYGGIPLPDSVEDMFLEEVSKKKRRNRSGRKNRNLMDASHLESVAGLQKNFSWV